MAEQWRILVVEGEEKLNWNIVTTLQKDGYFVRGVAGGAEAIRLLWSEEYDVVICNQNMPDADGFDLLQWMRTYCPNARMVMLAAPDGGVTRAQALEMGVASFLETPLDPRTLKEELRRLLHQTGFSASLDSFDLLDVIQIITMSRKSIALVISTGLEEEGILRFQNGELIWAEYGTLRGEEAFFALAAHKNGMVVHRPWNEQITPNVTQPLSRLIFQALQYRSKYAEYQQLSSEQEAIRSSSVVPDPPTLTPLPPATMANALHDLEEDRPFQFATEIEDDHPFQFVAENTSGSGMASSMTFEQLMRGSSTPVSAREQLGGVMGMVNDTEQGNSEEREWWEPTGGFASLPKSANLQTVTDENGEAALPSNGASITPSAVYKAAPVQSKGLPSWLTDQPTNLDLPVLRNNTGHMPIVTQERSPASPTGQGNSGVLPTVVPGQLPVTPPSASSVPSISAVSPSAPSIPGQASNPGTEWPEVPPTAIFNAEVPPATFNPSESGLRKIKPDEAYTGSQRAIKPPTGSTSTPLRPPPPEWQAPRLSPPPGQSEKIQAVSSPTPVLPQQSGDTLHSLSALKKSSAPLPPPEVKPAASPGAAVPIKATPVKPPQEPGGRSSTSSMPAVEKPTKRNYPALAAALQTLGYSVPGFVASAVVGLDGTPIAQVAVDELDISPMCAHFSNVIQGVMQALEVAHWEGYEHTVITNRTQHVLLRIVGNKKDVFQILVTTREADPRESLEVMANVEAAIAAALH